MQRAAPSGAARGSIGGARARRAGLCLLARGVRARKRALLAIVPEPMRITNRVRPEDACRCAPGGKWAGRYGSGLMSDERAPEVVEDLALGAFRMVKERLSFELDFTAETLPVVDHYLELLRKDDGGTPNEKVVSVVGPCVGAYFGEVVRRTLADLRWHTAQHDYQRWRVEANNVFLCFNPIGVALEALYREPLSDWNAHFTLLPAEQEIVNASLDSTGPVREDDFYRLSVRHEVLDQALSVLAELARKKGEHTRFGPDVYATVLGERNAGAQA